MKKIALDIIGLQPSMTQTHNYAVILGEQRGNRRLPIIIGAFEAQAIAVAVERISPNRPLTHDLLKNTLDVFGIEMREIIINNLLDGVFYARLVCVRNGEVFEIDSRSSDALAMAVRYNCPIYTYDFILETAGVALEESDETKLRPVKSNPKIPQSSGGTVPESRESLSGLPLDELERQLSEVLKNEDYEQAAFIRDEINRRKS
jgi:bifunctional DNase/RNase